MVSAQFLRNVPITRYLNLSTTTPKFVEFYSLDWNMVVGKNHNYAILYRVRGGTTSACHPHTHSTLY